MKNNTTPDKYLKFNETIINHQKNAEEWPHHKTAKTLIEWINRFNFEFKLEIPTPCLVVDTQSCRIMGTYRRGYNGIGTNHEITINTKFLPQPLGNTLETLLHEMLHLWQATHGKPGKNNYHNKEYTNKCMELGITSTDKGRSMGIIESKAFISLLEKHNIKTDDLLKYNPENPEPIRVKPKGTSKMKKWSCGCQNVRAGKKEFKAVCIICKNEFKLVIT
jgi:hypothetical protein